MAPATSLSTIVASRGSSASLAASSAPATFTIATLFFTMVPFLIALSWRTPDPYHLAGVRRATTASLQQLQGRIVALEERLTRNVSIRECVYQSLTNGGRWMPCGSQGLISKAGS